MTNAELPPSMGEWWSEEEFEPCPRCGERKMAPSSPSLDGAHIRVCVVCGVVTEPEIAP